MLVRLILAASVCLALAADAQARGGRGGKKSSSSGRSSDAAWTPSRSATRRPALDGSRGWMHGNGPGQDESAGEPSVIEPTDTHQGVLPPVQASPVTTAMSSATASVELVGRARTLQDEGQCVSMGSLTCIWDGQAVDSWPIEVTQRATRTRVASASTPFAASPLRPSLETSRMAVGYKPFSMEDLRGTDDRLGDLEASSQGSDGNDG